MQRPPAPNLWIEQYMALPRRREKANKGRGFGETVHGDEQV